jgi:YHS domain-containing protein
VTEQPGAKTGQKTYCPVSGAVFAIDDTRPHREHAGATYHFCCEGCAKYFDEHGDRVVAARHPR